MDFQTFKIDFGLHSENRTKLIDRLLCYPYNGHAVILKGGSELPKYDTDTVHAFRQESFFQYLFGVREPDCYGAIDLNTKQSILFVPRLSVEHELWAGTRPTLSEFKNKYLVDCVYYTDEIATELHNRSIDSLHVLNGINSDSKLATALPPDFAGICDFNIVNDLLYAELVACRVSKSEKELSLLRFINELSSNAHIQVMKTVKEGMMEYHAESTFLHYCYSKGGARLHAYTCICGSGSNGSALHYGHAGAPNDKQLVNGELFLNDMGAELHGYASDITCTFPVGGVFSQDHRIIYEAVLDAHDTVIREIKAGVAWSDMHILSHQVLTKHLVEAGLLIGTVEELMENNISTFFYPHGLGHLMGLDVHDVGGYPNGSKRSNNVLLKYLRCNRVLEEGMVLTVEPGCYFIEAQLNNLLASEHAKFVNNDMLARFRGTGGVRIESDIIVHKSFAENMTKVPRTIAEIERVMAAP